MSSITGTVHQTVVLDSQHYGSKLTILPTGVIAPLYGGVAGIEVPAWVIGGRILNDGYVGGGNGLVPGQSGGIAIDLKAAAALSNFGTIVGGAGYYTYRVGGAAGLGVDMRAGGMLSNAGLIVGGYGGTAGYGSGGVGGGGADLTGAMLINTGEILGGEGGYGGYDGDDGGDAGIGVGLVQGSRGVNSGLISGGTGNAGSMGGTGAVLVDSSLTNMGTISGGAAGGAYPSASNGGDGADLSRGSFLKSSGTIIAGAGGYSPNGAGGGGSGVVIDQSSVVASGVIIGGAGGNGGYYGANGGAGAQVNNGTLVLTGTVTGGAAGMTRGGPYADQHIYGGVGVSLDGGLVVNAGTITGGASDSASPATTSRASEGAGVVIDGGTLVTSGTINAGPPQSRYGAAPASVYFGTQGGTLVVDPGAVFNGLVIAQTGTGDTLALAGYHGGTLSGLGTAFSGFDRITIDQGAHWTLAGNAAETGTLTIDAGGTLTADGALAVARVAFKGPAELVLHDLPGMTSPIAGFAAGDVIDLAGLKVSSDSFAHGTLTLLDLGSAVGSLVFAGDYQQANFGIESNGHGGTAIDFMASSQAGALAGASEFAGSLGMFDGWAAAAPPAHHAIWPSWVA